MRILFIIRKFYTIEKILPVLLYYFSFSLRVSRIHSSNILLHFLFPWKKILERISPAVISFYDSLQLHLSNITPTLGGISQDGDYLFMGEAPSWDGPDQLVLAISSPGSNSVRWPFRERLLFHLDWYAYLNGSKDDMTHSSFVFCNFS